MSPYSSEIIRQTEMTAPLNSIRQKTKFETVDITGYDIQFIGDYCFAYSGEFEAKGDWSNGLDFNSGPNILEVRFCTGFAELSAESIEYQIHFNGTVVFSCESTHQATASAFTDFVDLIIPPFTAVIFRAKNLSSSTARTLSTVMTGKVQKGSERIQGAI